jgi:hypothetical protein
VVLDIHTVTIQAFAHPIDGATKIASLPEATGAAVSALCNVQKMKPGKVMQNYGLEASTAVEVFFEKAEVAKFKEGAVMTYEGEKYAFITEPITRTGVRSSYGMIVGEKLQYE